MAFAGLAFWSQKNAFAQGIGIDSLMPRIASEIHSEALANQLHTLIPAYSDQAVWGYAAGDFTNDTLPDLALSLYDSDTAKSDVHVYFFENLAGKKLVPIYDKLVSFVESPMEVGLTIDGSVVTVTRKTGEEQWLQEGYSIESGDITLVDRYETEKEDLTAPSAAKTRTIGHELYRNYETLRSKDSYFAASSGEPLLTESFFTLPAYNRLREIYPGYGHILSDTSQAFIISGSNFRRDRTDLSIRSMEAAYNDDYLYIAVRVRDDYVIGGQKNPEANDRVSFWFDTKYTGDRLNRDRRLISKAGGFPTFRTSLDSLVSNITFALPAHPGKVTEVTYSGQTPLDASQQDGLKNVKANMTYDTANGVVNGYKLTVRIPFSFLGFESNPEQSYETPVQFKTGEESSDISSSATITNAATLGFTALVYDVDDPTHPNEVTVQATSKYEEGNPATFGTLVLEPSSTYYGEVHPTYLQQLKSRLDAAGY